MTHHRPLRLTLLLLLPPPPLLLLLLLPLLPLLAIGCKQGTTAGGGAATASNLPTTKVAIGNKTYTLEIAAREAVRAKGLMYRDSMPEDHGMIFVFASLEERSFWMRNTRIPLDILYLDPAGKVVSIHRMEPYVERGTHSKAPATYAIELNAGQAGAAGVHEGDTLQLPDAVKNAKADP
jgi:uncharacterized membrane protein (UPF0127 family)